MRSLLGGAIAALVVVLGGAYAALSFGLLPLGADNVPGTIERAVGKMATDTWVSKHSSNQENPFKPTTENLIAGARDYEAHCAVCHGGARNRISPLSDKFSPPVPQLVDRIPHDPDADFWWVTKHGFRMTGMPSWDGILSDDQIWKIMVFLKHSDKLPPEAQAAWQAAAH